MLTTPHFPTQVWAVLPILQSLDDSQKLSLIGLLTNQNTIKDDLSKESNDWQTFINERNENLNIDNYDDF